MTSRAEPAEVSLAGHAVAFVKELLAVVIAAVIVAALLRALVGQMFVIPSISMQDTLQVHDRVLVEKLSTVQRGQIVVFEDPGGWLAEPTAVERGRVGQALEFVGVLPNVGTGHLIKRAVGLPGDRVVCCDSHGRVSVNDQPLEESEYLYAAAAEAPTPSRIRFAVSVPANHLFVLGDNRSHSRDSRCHLNSRVGPARGENAFVSQDLVVGRAVAVVWPLAAAHRLRTPGAYADLEPASGNTSTEAEVTAGPEASC